jgi:hypothetical protein
MLASLGDFGQTEARLGERHFVFKTFLDVAIVATKSTRATGFGIFRRHKRVR